MVVKLLLLSVCAFVLVSSSCEDVEPSSTEQEIGTYALVTTDYADEGCPALFEIEEEGQKVLLMPIELDDEFKVHGTEVLIEYSLSRIMQSECQKGRPIVIESILLVE